MSDRVSCTAGEARTATTEQQDRGSTNGSRSNRTHYLQCPHLPAGAALQLLGGQNK